MSATDPSTAVITKQQLDTLQEIVNKNAADIKALIVTVNDLTQTLHADLFKRLPCFGSELTLKECVAKAALLASAKQNPDCRPQQFFNSIYDLHERLARDYGESVVDAYTVDYARKNPGEFKYNWLKEPETNIRRQIDNFIKAANDQANVIAVANQQSMVLRNNTAPQVVSQFTPPSTVYVVDSGRKYHHNKRGYKRPAHQAGINFQSSAKKPPSDTSNF